MAEASTIAASGSKLLRELPITQNTLHRPQLDEYLTQKVLDKTCDGVGERELPPNEVDALALNDIAVAQGEGFFLHLPNRHSWGKQSYDPKSRGPANQLGASIPSLVFMRYTWSQHGKHNYFGSSYRTRYMASDFILNPPTPSTPLYGIQIASDKRYALYDPPVSSAIVLRTQSRLYFGSSAALKLVLGKAPRKLKGLDPDLRLKHVPEAWDTDEVLPKLANYHYISLEDLYRAIVDYCRDTVPSFTSGELRDQLPHPEQPEMGEAIGARPLDPRFQETEEDWYDTEDETSPL